MSISWKRIHEQMMAQKQKVALCTMLLAVALLLWGRLLLKDVPRTAVADPKAVAKAGEPIQGADVSTDNQGKIVTIIPAFDRVERDLFAFDPTYYPRTEQPSQTVQSDPKSASPQTDEDSKQQQLRTSVLIESRNLKLQSTLLGKRSRAMINGVLMEPGEEILGFELKEVRTRQVMLVKQGIEVVLEM
jgi:hypothetical protein